MNGKSAAISYVILATLFVAVLVGVWAMSSTSPAQSKGTVLITGSNRGIGLALTKEYASRGWDVIATCRNPDGAIDLQELAGQYPGIKIERLDVMDHSAIDGLALKYRDTPIDVLLNNAGINNGHKSQIFGRLDYTATENMFEVNTIGPLKIAEAFISQVEMSEQKKIMNISSSQGSITNSFGRSYFYRASKAAQNMVMHTLAVDLKGRGVIIGSFNPGIVRTDMTKGLDLPMISPEESAKALADLIDGFTLEMSGSFYNYNGEIMAW